MAGAWPSPTLQTDTEKTFFEGAEKLLEIWFQDGSVEEGKSGSLRSVPRQEWDKLLQLAHCQIISSISTKHIDGYVLSESSMFVSDRRYILKTCGTTRLMDALEYLLKLAQEYAGFTEVLNVFYSRKNFVRPELQPDRHRSFDSEIDHLNRFFSEDGAAYCLGRLNQDRWYLYTLNPPRGPAPTADQTLEILMSGLDRPVMDIFTTEVSSSGSEATKLSGIDGLLPSGALIDSKLFQPCGYSMNGVLQDTDEYVTIHVTPEEDFSYVSYESNVSHIGMFEQTCRVLECFKPSVFLMTLFANTHSIAQKDQQALWEKPIPGFKRKDLQFLTLSEDTLVYAQFQKLTPRDMIVAVPVVKSLFPKSVPQLCSATSAAS